MNYIMIRTDDMLNGDGLRVVLFCTACDHQCKNCHNPETWDKNNGHPFDKQAQETILKELENDYISGVTFSGGDPLHNNNVRQLYLFCKIIKEKFPNKTIWIYSGLTWEEIFCQSCEKLLTSTQSDDYRRFIIQEYCDVFVDGRYVEELSDVNYHWAGSTNQRVIDVKKTLNNEMNIVLYESVGA